MLKSKILLIIILILLLPSICLAGNKYYIRADGLWVSDGKNVSPFILLDSTFENLLKAMKRMPDGLSTPSQLTTLGDGASMSDVMRELKNIGRIIYNQGPEPNGLICYDYNIMQNTNFRNISEKDMVYIKCIEIFSSNIKTLKNVGVGSACKDVWAAHGTNYTLQNIGKDTSFYYKIGGRCIYFVVRDKNYLSDMDLVTSIIIF